MSKIKKGTIVEGFGHGFFGRDSYHEKVCIETGKRSGIRWALFHEADAYSFGPQFHIVYGDDLKALERWESEGGTTKSEPLE